jgi:hypothetical protein
MICPNFQILINKWIEYQEINTKKQQVKGCSTKKQQVKSWSFSLRMMFSFFFLLSFLCRADMFQLSMSTLSGTTTKRNYNYKSVIQNKKSAIIVGGGPVGLAGALMLEKCGWTDIKVIEKRASNYFESTKAYLYLVDRRGQRCTDLIGMIRFISLLSSSDSFYACL